MVLFARSDVIRVNPGGCGNPHQRPVKSRDPDSGEETYVSTWGIDCPACERILHDDVQWSKSRFRIPLTPDEIEEQKDLKEQADAAAERARMQRARDDAAAAMAARGTQSDIDPADMAITGPEGSGGAYVNAEGQSVAASSAADYNALSKAELKDLARDRGLPLAGTKDDLVVRHVEHDNK
jgi:hypothetical protein